MRLLVETVHPADVHQFKYMIGQLIADGHEILVCAWDKDVTIPLLKAYEIKHKVLATNRRGGLLYKIPLIVKSELGMTRIAYQFKPDVFVSGGSPISAHVSRLFRKPHIAFTDTEPAGLTYAFTSPFTDVMCVPSCFKNDFGKKTVRINGYKEIAYLHPNYFTPDASVLQEIGLTQQDKFIIVRFVSWNASHDFGQHGIIDHKKLVSQLEPYGKILITSEKKLDNDLNKYCVTVAPERLHDLLYYATLYIGEGATTASECAVLGTPAIYINTLQLGYLDEQEEEYGLVYNCLHKKKAQEQALNKALDLLQRGNLREEWQEKRKRMLHDKIDVTKFMIEMIENYPESYRHYIESNKN